MHIPFPCSALLPPVGTYLRLIQALAVVLTLGIVIVLLWIQRRTVSTLQRAVSTVTRVAGIPSFRHSSQLVDEIARARRYSHPLTVAIMKIQGGNDRNVDRMFWKRDLRSSRLPGGEALAFPFVACLLRDVLRDSDMVTYDLLMNRLVVVLLHAGKAQANACVQRVERSIRQRTGLETCVGTAEFPTDGFTIEEIVQRAQVEADGAHAAGRAAKVTELTRAFTPVSEQKSAAREAM